MIKLSNTQLISVWLFTLNSIALNSLILLNQLRLNKEPEQAVQKSQMEKVLENSIVKVAIYKNTAYWVLNNVLYRARIDKDGNIMDHEAEQIDVFQLSDKEVDNLLVILDSMKS